MANQVHSALVHTMSGNELSCVRTELYGLRILPAIAPHPVQANSQTAPQCHLGDVLVPTHGQVNVATSPAVGVYACRRLRGLHEQEPRQGIALFADMPQPLLATAGVCTWNHPNVGADLFAAVESFRSSDDQHIGECCQRAHAGMRHQS